jgi:hypothetical protein
MDVILSGFDEVTRKEWDIDWGRFRYRNMLVRNSDGNLSQVVLPLKKRIYEDIDDDIRILKATGAWKWKAIKDNVEINMRSRIRTAPLITFLVNETRVDSLYLRENHYFAAYQKRRLLRLVMKDLYDILASGQQLTEETKTKISYMSPSWLVQMPTLVNY